MFPNIHIYCFLSKPLPQLLAYVAEVEKVSKMIRKFRFRNHLANTTTFQAEKKIEKQDITNMKQQIKLIRTCNKFKLTVYMYNENDSDSVPKTMDTKIREV